MSDTQKMLSVNWRLPGRVASDNGGDWSAFRDHLAQWVASKAKLEVEVPEETKNVGLRVPAKVLKALEREATRISTVTGRKWTAGRVARHVWDEWEPSK